jgi:TRAP-type C4-dicarboxylate transport system permease small subunit
MMKAATVNTFGQVNDPLQIVATAVAPVVMVSATAILISGVNARYISISDRVRNLAHEYRGDATTAARKLNIQAQLVAFQRRMRLVSWAARLLYAAVLCYILLIMLICLGSVRMAVTKVALPVFVVGVTLVGIAIVLQFLEIQASHTTLNLEASEIAKDSEKGNSEEGVGKNGAG